MTCSLRYVSPTHQPKIASPKQFLRRVSPAMPSSRQYEKEANGAVGLEDEEEDPKESGGRRYRSQLMRHILLTLIFGLLTTLPGPFLQYFLPENSLASWAMLAWKL